MNIEGVDYSVDRPRPAELVTAGKKFAARYVGPGQAAKHLTVAEVGQFKSVGLSIVCVAEGYANGLAGGWNVGASWAASALRHARSLGMPEDRPIYLACDFDVSAQGWPHVANALRGAASVLGHDRVGIYGGYDAINWAHRDGVAQWGWQTYAWSGGRWHPWAHVHQYHNGVRIAGGVVDLDRAIVPDYGQWSPGQATPGGDVTHPPGSRTLFLRSPMMRGRDVAFVQRFIGPYRCGPADGIFGPRTRSGVRWYQDMRGITVDGIVGPVTWRHMGVAVSYQG